MKLFVDLPGRISAKISVMPSAHIVGITGPSGAGKSSFFRALAGVERNADVEMQWGRTVKKIGMVFQQPMLFPHVNVQGNIALAQRHASGNAIAVERILTGCCCAHLLDKDVNTLSGGEAQRVAIARALANGPDVLLLDESLSAVDLVTRRRIYQFLKSLCIETGLKCFIVSHDLEDLALFCDELIYISDGQVAMQGSASDVLNSIFTSGTIDSPSAVLEGTLVDHDEGGEEEEGLEDGGGGEHSEVMSTGYLTKQRMRTASVMLVDVANTCLYVSKNALQVESNGSTKQMLRQQTVRFAVKACDVSIDTNTVDSKQNTTSSILNALPCKIVAINEFEGVNNEEISGRMLLTLETNSKSSNQVDTFSNSCSNALATQTLYASVSAISVHKLSLCVGLPVIARFKLL